MKRLIVFCLAVLVALAPLPACGVPESRENDDIGETDITDVEPENEDEPVVIPDIDIVPDPEDVIELEEDLQTIFQLVIEYIYLDGTQAADTCMEILPAGTEYSVPSPDIDGYTAFLQLIDGVMPAHNVQYIVIYVSPEAAGLKDIVSLFAAEGPLGLGFTVDHTGVCSE